jgi:hypothetical protein
MNEWPNAKSPPNNKGKRKGHENACFCEPNGYGSDDSATGYQAGTVRVRHVGINCQCTFAPAGQFQGAAFDDSQRKGWRLLKGMNGGGAIRRKELVRGGVGPWPCDVCPRHPTKKQQHAPQTSASGLVFSKAVTIQAAHTSSLPEPVMATAARRLGEPGKRGRQQGLAALQAGGAWRGGGRASARRACRRTVRKMRGCWLGGSAASFNLCWNRPQDRPRAGLQGLCASTPT